MIFYLCSLGYGHGFKNWPRLGLPIHCTYGGKSPPMSPLVECYGEWPRLINFSSFLEMGIPMLDPLIFRSIFMETTIRPKKKLVNLFRFLVVRRCFKAFSILLYWFGRKKKKATLCRRMKYSKIERNVYLMEWNLKVTLY